MRNRKFLFCGYGIGQEINGVNRFLWELLQMIDKEIPPGLTLELLIPRDSEIIPFFQHIKVVRRGWRGKKKSALHKFLNRIWKQAVFPLYSFFHHCIGVDLTLCLPQNGIGLCAIHDCIRENYYARIGDRSLYQKAYEFKVNRITHDPRIHLITVSETSRQEIMSLYQVPSHRISVIGNGFEHILNTQSDDRIFERLRIDRKREYFFSLGGIQKHKNISWLLKAARENPQYDFVITGMNYGGTDLKISELQNIRFTGYLSDEEIKALYLGCKAFILPSFCEGFGIPVLEALALGKEAIVSDIPCFREIYGGAVHYIDPNRTNYDLDQVLAAPVGSAETILENHSWKRSALQLIELLQSIEE